MPDALTAFMDLLQSASAGSPSLDVRLESAFVDRPFSGPDARDQDWWHRFDSEPGSEVRVPTVRWSDDLMTLLRLIPSDHDFSLGERDGVFWAWIQPNDGWIPGVNEARHDHPLGSGLVVACTVPLAMAAALIAMLRLGKVFPSGGRRWDVRVNDQL